MPAFGVYPVADALSDGEEISSTYEGRHLTLLESELIHKAGNVGGFVDKGNPVVFDITEGHGVGVAFKSAEAATDLIGIDTEGIWVVDVVAADDGGNSAVGGGDVLYINNVTAVVSKIATGATQVPFGYALGIISTPGNIERIAVKLHWSPVDNWVRDLEPFYFGDGLDTNFAWKPGIIGGTEVLELDNLDVGQSGSALQIKAYGHHGIQDVGIAAYFDATAFGQSTGNWTYGAGIWLNFDSTFLASAAGWGGHEQVCPLSLGLYSGVLAGIADVDLIYGVKAEAIVGTATHGCYFAALNVSVPAPDHTAIFYAMNPESVGYTITNRSTQVGSLAIAFVNGAGHDHVFYVNLYEA